MLKKFTQIRTEETRESKTIFRNVWRDWDSTLR